MSTDNDNNITTTNDSSEKKKFEFSKILVGSIFILYLLGFVVGSRVVLRYPEGLVSYFTYIATPMTTVIGFYMWKSKAENVIKIKKNTGIDISMND